MSGVMFSGHVSRKQMVCWLLTGCISADDWLLQVSQQVTAAKASEAAQRTAQATSSTTQQVVLLGKEVNGLCSVLENQLNATKNIMEGVVGVTQSGQAIRILRGAIDGVTSQIRQGVGRGAGTSPGVHISESHDPMQFMDCLPEQRLLWRALFGTACSMRVNGIASSAAADSGTLTGAAAIHSPHATASETGAVGHHIWDRQQQQQQQSHQKLDFVAHSTRYAQCLGSSLLRYGNTGSEYLTKDHALRLMRRVLRVLEKKAGVYAKQAEGHMGLMSACGLDVVTNAMTSARCCIDIIRLHKELHVAELAHEVAVSNKDDSAAEVATAAAGQLPAVASLLQKSAAELSRYCIVLCTVPLCGILILPCILL